MISPFAGPIEDQLHALCSAIAADPEIQSARQQAEAFLADEKAVSLYRDVMTMGRSLQNRHHNGEEIAAAEVARFEDLQDQADGHEGIRAFNDAQERLQAVANLVNGFVTKTLERGAVPTQEEVFGGGGCGAGCGCHP